MLLWFSEFSLVSGASGILTQFGGGFGAVQPGPALVSALFVGFAAIQLAAAVMLVYGDRRALWVALAVGIAGLIAVPFLLRLPVAVVVIIVAGYAFMLAAAAWLLRTGDRGPQTESREIPPGHVLAALLLAVQSAVFALFLIAGVLSGSLGTTFYGVFALAGLMGAAGILLRASWGHPIATAAAAGIALVGVLLAIEVPVFGVVILIAALAALVLLIRQRP